jgi:hypothetical protein
MPSIQRTRNNFVWPVRHVVATFALATYASAWAWGDEGHMIVGEIATHFLQPAVRAKIDEMLATDTST